MINWKSNIDSTKCQFLIVPPVWVNPSSFRMLAVDCPDKMQLAIDRPYKQLLQWGTDLEIISITLWLCQNSYILKMTIEIVDVPIKNGGFFHSFLYVYQRVFQFPITPAIHLQGYPRPVHRSFHINHDLGGCRVLEHPQHRRHVGAIRHLSLVIDHHDNLRQKKTFPTQKIPAVDHHFFSKSAMHYRGLTKSCLSHSFRFPRL